jgi:malonate transporter and related proteins
VLQILLVTFPFFALVLAGYVAARRGYLPPAAIPGLNGFVLYFALPCMLFRFGSSTPIAQLLDGAVFGVYLLCALTMVAFAIAMTLSARMDWNNASFGALVAAFPNTGFMGIPLLVALMGPRAAGPAIVTIVVDLVITTSLCIALSRLGSGQGLALAGGQAGAGQAAKNALKGVASNPMPWAILSGALVSWLQVSLPAPVMQTLGLLADSASPVALFTIGAVLARSQTMAQTGKASSVPAMDYVPLALMKLILHPLLVLLVGSATISLGVPLDRFALTVIVLVAALPSASNVSLLAEKFEANNGRIARIILVSTVLAFFSFAGVVKLVAR